MIPGIGGSLGQCGYCGENFIKEIVLGESVRTIRLGGVGIPLHKKDCFDKLMALGKDGGLVYEVWKDLPEKSPLRSELKRLEEETAQAETIE